VRPISLSPVLLSLGPGTNDNAQAPNFWEVQVPQLDDAKNKNAGSSHGVVWASHAPPQVRTYHIYDRSEGAKTPGK